MRGKKGKISSGSPEGKFIAQVNTVLGAVMLNLWQVGVGRYINKFIVFIFPDLTFSPALHFSHTVPPNA